MGDDEYLRASLTIDGHKPRRQRQPEPLGWPELAAVALLAGNLVCLYLLFR